jgi:hypothetical protein
MSVSQTARPAPALHGEPVSSESLRGSKLSSNTQPLIDRQAIWLTRRYISSAMAWAVVPHVFGEVRA